MSDHWMDPDHPLAQMRADLPVHLPIPVDAGGRGPVPEEEANRVVCWCGSVCQLEEWLRSADRVAERRGRGDV